MNDFTNITEHLDNVRGGFDGSDGGYCSTDPRTNAANGRYGACGGESPSPTPSPSPSPLPSTGPTPSPSGGGEGVPCC